MDVFPIEVWVVFQMIIDLFLIILFLLILKGMKFETKKNIVKQASEYSMNLIKPVLIEAELVSKRFNVQLDEKKKLINSLNEKLDAKIDKLTFLTDQYNSNINPKNKNTDDVFYNRQKEILRLYAKGNDSYNISKKLLITQAEVELLLDFKKKERLDFNP